MIIISSVVLVCLSWTSFIFVLNSLVLALIILTEILVIIFIVRVNEIHKRTQRAPQEHEGKI